MKCDVFIELIYGDQTLLSWRRHIRFINTLFSPRSRVSTTILTHFRAIWFLFRALHGAVFI